MSERKGIFTFKPLDGKICGDCKCYVATSLADFCGAFGETLEVESSVSRIDGKRCEKCILSEREYSALDATNERVALLEEVLRTIVFANSRDALKEAFDAARDVIEVIKRNSDNIRGRR